MFVCSADSIRLGDYFRSHFVVVGNIRAFSNTVRECDEVVLFFVEKKIVCSVLFQNVFVVA